MLRTGATRIAVSTEDPEELLLAAHAHAREIVGLALELARAPLQPLPTIAKAAERLVRFFEHELPVHEGAEEDIVVPALLAKDRRIAPTIGLVAVQHTMLKGVARELLDQWQALARAPSELDGMRATLASATERFADMFEKHLELEESLLLPKLRDLPERERRAICARLHVPRD